MGKMPFQPNVGRAKDGPLTARHREQESMFENKWEFLHADSVRKTKAGKQDITQDEIEMQRAPNEYTFRPNRNRREGGIKAYRHGQG